MRRCASPSCHRSVSCPTIDPRTAEASARAEKHAFRVFDRCVPIRDLAYSPLADDAFELGASHVDWDDATSVAFSHHVDGALRIARANHTTELIQSDANCPYLGVNRIGFALRFDAVSSKLAESKAGIDCVVCLR